MFSCDPIYPFGTINNQSHRRVRVVISDYQPHDSDIYLERARTFKLAPNETAKLHLGFGLPQVSNDHYWYVKFYDDDTLRKYYHDHLIIGSSLKAYLKEDTILRSQMSQRNIRLIYNDVDTTESKR